MASARAGDNAGEFGLTGWRADVYFGMTLDQEMRSTNPKPASYGERLAATLASDIEPLREGVRVLARAALHTTGKTLSNRLLNQH
jgi:hypothetical protein